MSFRASRGIPTITKPLGVVGIPRYARNDNKLLPYRRQLDLEDCSLSYLTPHRDLSAVIADDAAHDPQTEAGAFLAFGRDKRFEDALLQISRNSRTGISHQNANAAEGEFLAGVHMARAQQQTPTIRHSIFCINNEVREHLPELIGRDDCVRQF